MGPAGSQSALKTSVDHKPRIDDIGKRPQRGNEARIGRVQRRISVELTGEIKSTANRTRECQVELVVLVEPGLARATNQEMCCVKVKMDMSYVFAGQKCERMVHLSASQAAFGTGRRDLDLIIERQAWDPLGLLVKPNL